eukprot:5203292-Prymnesium_polylepis.1
MTGHRTAAGATWIPRCQDGIGRARRLYSSFYRIIEVSLTVTNIRGADARVPHHQGQDAAGERGDGSALRGSDRQPSRHGRDDSVDPNLPFSRFPFQS